MTYRHETCTMIGLFNLTRNDALTWLLKYKLKRSAEVQRQEINKIQVSKFIRSRNATFIYYMRNSNILMIAVAPQNCLELVKHT